MAEVELFTSKNTPYGQRVAIALTEKKIPFKFVAVDLKNKSQAFLDANPIHKKVPAIVHNGKGVAESVVILEYLEDAFPEVPLMPEDAYEKSQVRFWTDYICKLFGTVQESFRLKPGTPEKEAVTEAIINCLKTLESTMNNYSSEGPFFTGDKFGYLDVVLSPFCNAVIVLKNLADIEVPGPEELPRLHKWFGTVRAYPSVNTVIPTADEVLAFFKSRFSAAPKPE